MCSKKVLGVKMMYKKCRTIPKYEKKIFFAILRKYVFLDLLYLAKLKN